MIHQVSCSILMQTWLIIFLLEKNHSQLSQFVSSKKWYIRLPTKPWHKHFLLEWNHLQFAPFCSSTKMMCRVFSHLSTPTCRITCLLEKNHCQCSQFWSSNKNDTSGHLSPLDANQFQQTKPVASSKQCIHQEMTDYLQYHIFTWIELRRLAVILF